MYEELLQKCIEHHITVIEQTITKLISARQFDSDLMYGMRKREARLMASLDALEDTGNPYPADYHTDRRQELKAYMLDAIGAFAGLTRSKAVGDSAKIELQDLANLKEELA